MELFDAREVLERHGQCEVFRVLTQFKAFLTVLEKLEFPPPYSIEPLRVGWGKLGAIYTWNDRVDFHWATKYPGEPEHRSLAWSSPGLVPALREMRDALRAQEAPSHEPA